MEDNDRVICSPWYGQYRGAEVGRYLKPTWPSDVVPAPDSIDMVILRTENYLLIFKELSRLWNVRG